ncbi:bifunctional uridylyltransferase/uridylyl-removing enzyme [Kordiimonas sediminis]|uniref:Bifunctional uridylyltransferase/uridylyl-removing enzyme n=1 Tax=Kordiimonas sediminis TaxID=1735581 RepID=A0A919E3I1_9PROT|nr:[protein-PII] uridylyltransferase [Kordiimonas sediminis]GHF15872.1 bifunctional uridylyltransferase/uridylyl-removing enzyme [Kordiimonas sediminis]
MSEIRNRRKIINRKALVSELEALVENEPKDQWRQGLFTHLNTAYKKGWNEVKRRFFEDAEKGRQSAKSLSFLTDQILGTLFEFVVEHIYPIANPTSSERLCMVATGGYGRGEMAPYSDVDLLFLIPYKSTPWAENVIEYMLYVLWDMGLKVGHATRTPEECIKLARDDLSIRTSLLESRYLWGDRELFDIAAKRFLRRVVMPTGKQFVEEKLAERDARHRKMGDSRYVVEPNIKEGKGGLRDLQTMWWIARYLYGGMDRQRMTKEGILTEAESKQFRKAESFLWTIRVALHFLANRAEERLTFDMQRQLAEFSHYRDRTGILGVERFMKHYFLVAKQVGDLTRIFCASLEEKQQKPTLLDRFRRTKKVQEFAIDNGRLNIVAPDDFKENPALMVKIFAVADKEKLDIHPDALRLIKENLKRIGSRVRRDPDANEYFLDILTSPNQAEINLRRMNEAGVFGRFIPDFGRVVAQMQYDMYHHYTVDEHTIRAIGLLSRIEKGELTAEHPTSSDVIHKILSRRVLYVAVLLHDVAKGRGGDHSVLGAEVAEQLCPRLGMTPAQTQTVAWLVRYHLLMSDTAFKRDLADPKTIRDFCDIVKSPERLRLLLVLTVVDIRAVGPGIWNNWKAQLLRDLYYAAEEVLLAGHASQGRQHRVKYKQEATSALLTNLQEEERDTLFKRLNDAYWIAEDAETAAQNIRLIKATDEAQRLIGVSARIEADQDMTKVAVYTGDHPGLFARVVGALGVAGASIVTAKIHTSRDGMAMDNFMVQNSEGGAFGSRRQLDGLEQIIVDTLLGDVKPKERLVKKKMFGTRTEAFKIEPVVLLDNKASNRSTVIEVNAKDRPGLLYDLAYALFRLRLSIYSAHVATYGERAVDVFYVRDLVGQKITNKVRLRNIETKLLRAADGLPIFDRKETGSKPSGSKSSVPKTSGSKTSGSKTGLKKSKDTNKTSKKGTQAQ